ncbi:unannotated protein [freshwater metagenome]|uniref:Unannotated protein n=1 Tax=freshwater metagenome TaxID=449393 RepID=A0A6J6RAG2_9ZZZZ
MGLAGRATDLGDDLLGHRRALQADELGGVAGAEVELVTLLVLHRHRGERLQAVVGLDAHHADVDAVVEALDQGVVAVGVGANERRGQRGQAVDAGHAEGAAAAGGLDDDAGAEAVHHVLHERGGADVAEGLGRQPDALRDGYAGAAQQLAGRALVPRDPAGAAARPDVRQADQLEQRLDLAVLAELAVQGRQGGADLVVLERVQQVAVEVVGVRLDADRAKLTDQVAPAGQRHVALVAEAARDDGDGSGELLGHDTSVPHAGRGEDQRHRWTRSRCAWTSGARVEKASSDTLPR